MKQIKENHNTIPTNQNQNTPGKKAVKKNLPNITVHRKDIDMFGDDPYGHWWTNVSPDESYGWWPKYPVESIWDTLTGVEGELNGTTSFGGTSTRDPHHGDTSGNKFKVVTTRTDSESVIQSEMRNFARSYSGEWRWTFGYGQNCHTFQEDMLEESNLQIEK